MDDDTLPRGVTLLQLARHQMHKHCIPRERYEAYRAQRTNAGARGIPFRFTLIEWCDWWDRELSAIGQDAARGRTADRHVMARYGDIGAYEPGNVFCTTPAGNVRSRDPDAVRDAVARIRHTREANGHPLGQHLKGATGDAHPKSRAIVTPAGRFGSMAEAGRHYGVTRVAIWDRVRRGEPGYRYADAPG